MTQQSHCWAYTLRKPELNEACVPQMFITALFIIARTWKQPRCPSADKWIRKLWYIYTMEYYSAIKKNTFESVLMSWMKLEPIIQSEVSQKEKHQYSIESESEVSQSCPTLCDPMDTGLLCPWDFLGKSTGVGCHFLLHAFSSNAYIWNLER